MYMDFLISLPFEKDTYFSSQLRSNGLTDYHAILNQRVKVFFFLPFSNSNRFVNIYRSCGQTLN